MVEFIMIKDGKFSDDYPQGLDADHGWDIGLRGDFVYDGFIRYEKYDNYVHMIQIYVNEQKRLRGTGTRLIQKLEELASDKEIIYVETGSTEVDNFGKFLVKMGFERLPPFIDVDGKRFHWYKKI